MSRTPESSSLVFPKDFKSETRVKLQFLRNPDVVGLDDLRVQRVLGGIWSFASFFLERAGDEELQISAPTKTLIKWGLVSETTAGQIKRRVRRKAQLIIFTRLKGFGGRLARTASPQAVKNYR
ncbi:hypothetical protein COT65_00680 [Candidatus Shapirobacteria bacterium CG09_land_8_20_14_0_10_47_13]|uniref:Uncharacterized protein n=1 Tax=Candidatus Shapirobacteria bacterium CG09_land_8_20_14_0_10_47_13 TaxID=1974481 RepID=A0A2H0WN48_9BACT|nr:MAG: hypothetical protein COT65_00680 [Candidatus Shapirobacteria bacterium CG09_land_8_20_14_0_10_47_13]